MQQQQQSDFHLLQQLAFLFCGLSKRNFCVGINFSSSESNSLSNSLFFGINDELEVGRRGRSPFPSSLSSPSSSLLFFLLIFFNFSNLLDMVTSFVEGVFFICSNIALSLLLTYVANEPIIGF